MKLTELILDHIELTKLTKEESCRHNGGPSDLMPMMIWVDTLGKTGLACIEHKGNTMDYMPKALNLVAQQDPEFVLFVAESLAMKVDGMEALEEFKKTHKSGDLAKMHAKRGPLSGIEELIAFNGLNTNTGEQVQGFVKFHYNDIGVPIFGETTVQSIDEKYIDESNVTSVFNQFYKFMVSRKACQN